MDSSNSSITNSPSVASSSDYTPDEEEEMHLSPAELQQSTTIICRGNLPKAAVEDLKKWLFQHFHYPYPNDAEKEKLMAQTGLTLTQVNNWFINARRRIWKPIVERRQKDQLNKRQQQMIPSGLGSQSSMTPPSPPNMHQLMSSPSAQFFSANQPIVPFQAPNALGQTALLYPQPAQNTLSHGISVKLEDGMNGGDHQRQSQATSSVQQQTPPQEKVNPLSIEALFGVETGGYDEYMKNPAIDKNKKKRSYEEAMIDENYNQMLDEYNRLRKENNGLKTELRKLSTNYQKLYADMNKRQQLLSQKLAEAEAMQEQLETINKELSQNLHERKRPKLSIPKPLALRPAYEKRKDGTEGLFKPIRASLTHPHFRSLETRVTVLQNCEVTADKRQAEPVTENK